MSQANISSPNSEGYEPRTNWTNFITDPASLKGDRDYSPHLAHPHYNLGGRTPDLDKQTVLLPYVIVKVIDFSKGPGLVYLLSGLQGVVSHIGWEVLEATKSASDTLQITSGSPTAANGTVTVADAGGTATHTVVIGGVTYRLVETTVGTTPGNVLIGADGDATAINLARAINSTATGEGVTHVSYSAPNPHVTAVVDGTTADQVNLTARPEYHGIEGNEITLVETGDSFTVSADKLANGADGTEVIAAATIDTDDVGDAAISGGDISTSTAMLLGSSTTPLNIQARLATATTTGITGKVRVFIVVLLDLANVNPKFGEVVTP